MSIKTLLGAIALTAVSAALTNPANADLIFTGTGTDSQDSAPISATATFSLSGDTLQIVLTDNDPAMSQASVLTNLGFTHAPSPAFALPSASGTVGLTAGSALVSGTTVDTTDTIGSEWAYLSGGLASSGFGIGTGNGNLCGTPGCVGVPLDGSAFGLVGKGSPLSSNALKPANTYIDDSLTFDIVLPANSGFSLSQITSVDFQYGTMPGEGNITVGQCTGGSNCSDPVPEPATWLIMLFTLLGLGAMTRTLRRNSPEPA